MLPILSGCPCWSPAGFRLPVALLKGAHMIRPVHSRLFGHVLSCTTQRAGVAPCGMLSRSGSTVTLGARRSAHHHLTGFVLRLQVEHPTHRTSLGVEHPGPVSSKLAASSKEHQCA